MQPAFCTSPLSWRRQCYWAPSFESRLQVITAVLIQRQPWHSTTSINSLCLGSHFLCPEPSLCEVTFQLPWPMNATCCNSGWHSSPNCPRQGLLVGFHTGKSSWIGLRCFLLLTSLWSPGPYPHSAEAEGPKVPAITEESLCRGLIGSR